MKEILKRFDAEFPACTCSGNGMPPHFDDSNVNRDWIKQFIQKEITDLLMSMPLEENEIKIYARTHKTGLYAGRLVGRNELSRELRDWRSKILK
jgi:hypothetical protein